MADRPILGICLMLGFCLAAPMADALAKLLGAMPLIQILLIRFGVQALLLAPMVAAGPARLPRGARVLRLVLWRTLLHIAGIGVMVVALRYLPLADAITIAFVQPFLMLLVGYLILHEHVGPHRLSACAVGFIGVVLVIRPNYAEVGSAALLPLAMAVIFTVFTLVTRQLAKLTDPIGLQTLSGALAVVILLPIALWQGQAWPGTDANWPMIIALGVAGTVAHLLMTWALRYAPTSTLAPMQYLEIPFATFIGWLVFGDLPDGIAMIGITVTVAAGLYVIAHEQASAVRARAPLSPPPDAPSG